MRRLESLRKFLRVEKRRKKFCLRLFRSLKSFIRRLRSLRRRWKLRLLLRSLKKFKKGLKSFRRKYGLEKRLVRKSLLRLRGWLLRFRRKLFVLRSRKLKRY